MRASNRRGRARRRTRRGGGCLTLIAAVVLLSLAVCGGIGGYKIVSEKISNFRQSITLKQYPTTYERYVEKYAKKYDMDKYLIFAVIRTESKFDRYAVSGAKAYGLMQIQKETASDCARKLDMKAEFPDDLYDPDINIHIGTYYLKTLLDKYDGDISLAVAAYNSGSGNVDSWLKDDRYSDGSGGLSEIPFPETAGYVTGVNASYAKYKELYE